jgi:glycosyltransferase involved in cell wall biosynthesis
LSRPLRVALALESSGPGGAEKMVADLAAALLQAGAAPVIVTQRPGWMTNLASRSGIPFWLEPQRPGLDPGFVLRLARRLRSERIDVLHTHEFAMNVYGGVAALLARVSTVATIHGRHWVAEKPRRALAYRVLSRLGVPIVAVSDDLAGYLAPGLGIPRERLRVVHNGIPLAAVPPREGERAAERAKARAELGLPPDGPLLVAVGNLYPVKDHATLLRAAAPIGGVRVAIAGRGGEEESLRRLARELGCEARVHLLGLRDDVPRILAAADVFVQSSRSEGLPLAILEAMGAALPIVATRVGGVPEAVSDGECGRLVPPGDPAALEAALRGVLESPDRGASLARAARRRAEGEFSVARMAERYLALYTRS